MADVQVRNRGTLGGNICVNDPTNHFPPLLVALGATMTIRSAGGERTVAAEEFFVGVFETAVEEGELLTRISIPAGGQGHGRRDGGRDARGARDVHRERGRVRRRRRPGASRSVASPRCRSARRGRDRASPARTSTRPPPARRSRDSARRWIRPSDVHASADYRRSLAETSAVRAVLQASERAKG